MGYHTLEAIFKYKIQLIIFIVLLPVVGLAIAYFLPRPYQATAALWALHRSEVIGSTGPESDLTASPADTQVAALMELLHTQAFTLAVAQSTGLAGTLDLSPSVLANPQKLDTAISSELSQHVQVVSQGYNLYTISYQNRDPQVAQKIVVAIVKNYGMDSVNLSTTEGQSLLQTYQSQLTTAQQNVSSATAAEEKYLSNNPQLAHSNTPINDPKYAELQAQAIQAQKTLETLQEQISTVSQEIQAQGTGDEGLYKVVDMPPVPNSPISRTRPLLVGGGVGIVLALLVCIIYITLLVRRDRTIRSASDLQKIASLPIMMQVPNLSVEAKQVLMEP